MSERRRRREVNAEEGEQSLEEEKAEEDVVYWLIKKPKNVPATEIQSMRCPRRPRHTKRVLETSDGQLLEAHFEEPKRRMFTLKLKSTSLQKETKKFKPDADVLGMVHISRSMNPDEMTQPQKDYFYTTEDPNEMK